MLQLCPAFLTSPLVESAILAEAFGIGALLIKDERARMGLGSFKALGAAYVIAVDAMAKADDDPSRALNGETYVTASAGNHGMSVAAGSAIFGANAVVYIAETVPQSFAQRLAAKGATVVRQGADYAASMSAALDAATTNGWHLLSDSSWPGYLDVPHRLMEGYLQLAEETVDAIVEPPSHIFLQAGVGGFAAAVAALLRERWKDTPRIVVVEPDAAPALQASITAGKPTICTGPVSTMGRLDCKEPSLIALKGLARDADQFVTISDQQVNAVLPLLKQAGLETTPSGAAGLAALHVAQDVGGGALGLDKNARVLTFITECVE